MRIRKPEYPARGCFQPGLFQPGSVPARGCIQARASSKPEVVPGEGFFQSGQGVFLLRVVRARSLFQLGACASEGFVPATGWFQPREFQGFAQILCSPCGFWKGLLGFSAVLAVSRRFAWILCCPCKPTQTHAKSAPNLQEPSKRSNPFKAISSPFKHVKTHPNPKPKSTPTYPNPFLKTAKPTQTVPIWMFRSETCERKLKRVQKKTLRA